MKHWLLLSGCLFAAAAAHAAGNSVTVADAWVRWLPGDLPAGGYATIANHSATAIRLLEADSPDYAMVMLHRSVQRDGVEKMESVDGMDVPAQGSAKLAPGGYHLMLMQPRHTIAPGDHVQLRLHFSDGETVESDFAVRPATAQDSTH
ncbi:MAG: copper chaperone PCu(A)C [Rudaea sp.]